MRIMAGRKRHSAEDIVRKLRRADELAAQGKTGEEIAADLEVSAATFAPGLENGGLAPSGWGGANPPGVSCRG